MSCRRALNGVLALLVTVLAGAGPAAAQEKSGPVTSPPSPVEDVVHHRKGWEPKEDEEFEIDADEPGAYSDTVRLTDRSAKARPVLGTMQRSGAMGTADLRQLLPGVPFKRDRERRENEGPTPHPVLLPGTEGTASAVEQEPGGGILRATPQPAAPAPSPIASFDGLDSTFAQGYPPDNTGDVGPAHYIEAINSSIGIFDKATGTRLVGLSLDSFMGQGNFGNLCDNNNYGDPVVLYDSFEDRWIITDFAFSTDTSGNVTSNVYQCFAVSRTGDPVSGGWYFYSDMTSDALPDYPKFGVWTDGIYRSANNFGPGTNGGSFVGSRAWAYNKAQMYAGAATVQIVQFDNPDASDFTLLPSNARLQTGTPPTGRPNYFVSLSQYLNSQNVYAFKVDWDRPTLSTFALVGQPLASNSWANASPPNNPTPKNALDALGIRAMMQNQYTNIGGVESLWNSHTVRRASTGSNVPRWYQINVTGGSVAANDVQSTNWDPDAANTNYRWMPSLAVDRAGNMAIGYSLSNSTTNPKIMYAGRLAGDPVNTFSQTEQTLIAGTGAQTGNCGSSACARWGDYTTMTLDPDGCTFWYVNEYYTSNDLKFRTRIGAFRYPSCTPVGSGGTISGTVTGNPGGTPIAGASVQLGSRVATTDASGFYSFTVPAGTYPVEIASAAGYNAVSATSLVVADGGSTTQDFSLSAAPAGACYTDTTQSDFQTGALTNIDLGSSPGDALLTSTSRLVSAKQETDSGSGFTFTNTTWSAQTFTATASGQLTGADIGMFCNNCSGANPDITVSVRAVSGNLPTGADLATATLPGFNDGGVGGFKSVTFATPVSITSGTQYALVVRSVSLRGSGSYIYSVSNTSGANPYSGGRNATSTNSGTSWSGQTRSLVFRAYVTVPRTYSASGDLVSNAKDANPAPGYTSTWNTLNWTGATPAGTTLRFQAAGSNLPTGPFAFVGPGGSAATYFNSGDSLGQFNGKRYLKYRAYLATSNTANSPVLSDVSLCSTNQPPAPVATKLAFTQQPPASSPANAPFAVKVAVQDAGGNVVTGDTSAVTLALSGGTAGASLAGTATVNAVGGIATFPNLSVDLAGSAYKLVASDGSLAGATSDPFDIVPNTYTVGGTVSGLSGSMSLKLDGTNPTTTQTQAFTSSGAFAFTTPLQAGSGWTVSVASQPAGQTCTVTGGSGTNLSGNVSTVQVSCTTNTYTIGGSVTGLTSSGLVMAVTAGSQTVSVAPGASSYAFPTAVPHGSSYVVSVQTQPTGQTCTVANPSGTVSGANVTNANVTCATNNYTVGGTIAGLSGSVTLKLASTGSPTSQQQAFTTNGAFTFASSVSYGADWTVSVVSQPVGQTCAVTGGSGTNLSGNVTSVQVSCAAAQYAVTAAVSGGNGTITPASQQVNHGGSASFTVTPSTGYHVASVAGDTCTVTGSGTSYSAANITQACAVTATFAINTYTVGGTVSGLSGSVSLKLDGTNPTTTQTQAFTSNGAFAFTTPLSHGSGWTVSVASQPVGQTCTVTGGSGTNLSGNVSTVQVSCTANTYTIGGSVTGLTSSGLVMAVTAGSQTVSVASGASSYAFPTAVPHGSSYVVSVQTQPTGQTCTVANPSGTVTGANVTNANVTCSAIAYTVSASVSGGNGTITPASQQVNHGGTASFTVTPSTGYHVASVAGDTCTVTGSGTSYSAPNITQACTVVATFAINTYTVGGTVSGLGGSVSLKLDGTNPATTQTQAFTSNGAFAFTTPLSHGSGWTVSVASQPAGQTCTVAGGSGSSLSANVTSVQVSCAANQYTVTASVSGGNGTITPASQQVTHGGSASFTVTPNTGYHVASVTGSTCTVTGSGTSYSAANVTQACAVTATFAINQYTVTASVSGGNGTITPASQSVNHGGSASFTVTPATGYHVASVAGDTCTVTGSGTSYNAPNIIQACAVTATFAINTYTVGGTVSGLGGSVSLKLDGTNPTTTQTQAFTSNGAFAFTTPLSHGSGWTVSVATQPAGQTCTVTGGSGTNLSGSVTSVQVSCAATQYTVTASVSGGNGTITPPTQQVNHGGSASFTVTPATGYHVASVAGDTCTVTGSGTSYSAANVTQACAVVATFAINQYAVTASVSGGNGTITPPSQQVNHGGSASFTVTPATGYHVASVAGDTCTVTGSGTSYSAANVTQACAVVATFAINQYAVTASVSGGNGTITPPSQQVNHGGSASFTVTPATGYHVASVAGDTCTVTGSGTSYSAANVTQACAVVATFAINQYAVTASVSGGNGTITPPTQQVNHGSTASFTVTPATGYHVASVAGDTCTVTGSGTSYSAANVTQACAVVATFAINQYAVTASVSGGNGTITPPSQQVNHGSTASFTVAPAAGYHAVLPLGGTCPAGTLAGSTYTTAAVTAACTISVTFARNPPHHLAFLTPLADVGRGNRLGAAQVAIVDEQGAVIATDSTSQITLTTQACGASVTLGQATVSNGVATFPAGTSGRFFTLANGRTITAGSGSLGGSATVNVVANADLAFADDFELCRL